jgi:hypothetical protein
MMDNILNLLPDFETLLRTKSYAELTSSEKSAVLKFMTIEEYETMRSNAAKVSEAFAVEENNLLLDKNLENTLVGRLSKKKEKQFAGIPELLSSILGLKMPVYQVAILILVGLFLIPKSDTRIVTKVLPISRVDTVFVEKPITRTASEKYYNKTNNNYPIGKKRISNQHISKIRPVLLNQNSPFFANIVTHFQSEKTGHPIESDSNLYWRLVTVQLQDN